MKIIRPAAITDSVLFSSNVAEADYTAFSAATIYSAGTRVRFVGSDIHKIYESITGSTSTVTMTIAAPCVVTWSAHGRAEGDPISFTTTGALPTGLVSGTAYYVKTPTANTFNVAATVGGAAITTTGTQSGTHTAISSLNYNHTPPNATYWLDVGATNRWKCFDVSVASQTSNTSSIANVFHTTGRVDSVALLNVNAASATITQTDATEGVVYSETFSMVSDSGITNMFDYFMEPIERISDKVVTNLLPYANSTIAVTLTDAGSTVLCGCMILGLAKDISYLNNGTPVGVELGVKLSTQDYSVKQRDAFGNYTILERAFNKRADFTVYVEGTYVDSLMKLLSGYRATPVVYLGTGAYASTAVYGFYKDFSIDIAHHTKSICSISIEGLT